MMKKEITHIKIVNKETGEVITELSGPSLGVEINYTPTYETSFAPSDENQVTLFEEEK